MLELCLAVNSAASTPKTPARQMKHFVKGIILVFFLWEDESMTKTANNDVNAMVLEGEYM